MIQSYLYLARLEPPANSTGGVPIHRARSEMDQREDQRSDLISHRWQSRRDRGHIRIGGGQHARFDDADRGRAQQRQSTSLDVGRASGLDRSQ